jgi:hypothetical protein
MIDGRIHVLTVAAAVGSGVMAGVFFAFSTFVMRALGRLPAPQGIAASDEPGAAHLLVASGAELARPSSSESQVSVRRLSSDSRARRRSRVTRRA